MDGRFPVCYIAGHKRRGRYVLEAIVRGAGGGAIVAPGSRLAGVPVFWGVSDETAYDLARARASGRPWVYVDHAYLGTRGARFRLTAGALQHDGTGPADPARFDALGIRLAPWRRAGDYILICPPGDAWCRLTGQGYTASEWLCDVEARVRAATARPIRVRRKPPPGARACPLTDDLAGAWCLVTDQSTAALEAFAAGVPVFTTSTAAPAARCGSTDLTAIERPVYPPDRSDLMASLAARQWSIAELAEGIAWRALAPELAR